MRNVRVRANEASAGDRHEYLFGVFPGHYHGMTELFAWEVIRRVVGDLPVAIQEGENIYARSSLAWADTLAWLVICRAGVALPHGIAMAVGGMFPDSPHGAALAAIYRACLEFTWALAVPKFAGLARILDPGFRVAPNAEAASACSGLLQKFLEQIGLNGSLKTFGILESELCSARETIHGAS